MEKHEPDLLFPISDTIPGPGAFAAKVLDADDESKIPVLKTRQSLKSFGHGTAEDIPSTAHTDGKDKMQ